MVAFLGALLISQVLTFSNVGTRDIGVLDPALGPDANSALAVGMIYTGLVKFDKNLNVVPDQNTWVISLIGAVIVPLDINSKEDFLPKIKQSTEAHI